MKAPSGTQWPLDIFFVVDLRNQFHVIGVQGYVKRLPPPAA
ncbi:hypothetical protein PFLUOLIPICF7_27100 [Pseudomonas simiae]|jgi:hypothetical protein|uniref:Uncharacterized protein n=1 Tax=Pseudomonas simiae TaxID=321846 RepID=U1URS5_9PSED|nr:hypothetical protein PFLUOLIPICF7_27100 [Pseudomonas simiae]ERH57787.1 hypothetical protein O204_24815 [Pseudomonas simiae]